MNHTHSSHGQPAPAITPSHIEAQAAMLVAARTKRGTGSTTQKLAQLLSSELSAYLGQACEVSVDSVRLRPRSMQDRHFNTAAWRASATLPAGDVTQIRVASWSTISECVKAKRLSLSPFAGGIDVLPLSQS